MVPPRLPPGDYELTLRSRLADGHAGNIQTGRGGLVSRGGAGSGVNRSRAEVSFNVPETAATNRLSLDRATRSSQARPHYIAGWSRRSPASPAAPSPLRCPTG
jgi:hypothetical protein